MPKPNPVLKPPPKPLPEEELVREVLLLEREVLLLEREEPLLEREEPEPPLRYPPLLLPELPPERPPLLPPPPPPDLPPLLPICIIPAFLLFENINTSLP